MSATNNYNKRKRKQNSESCKGSIKKFFSVKTNGQDDSADDNESPALINCSIPSTSQPGLGKNQCEKVSNNTYSNWIKLKGFDKELDMNVFSLHANGGILCVICSKHSSLGPNHSNNRETYVSVPAKPTRPIRLENHLNSEQHKRAVNLEIVQRSSRFHAIYEDRTFNKTTTVAEIIITINLLIIIINFIWFYKLGFLRSSKISQVIIFYII